MRRYFSDASLDAVGGFSSKLNVLWRYGIETVPSLKLRHLTANRTQSDVSIGLLEFFGMFFTAWCLIVLTRDLPVSERDSILMRRTNVSAVSRVNRWGGSRDARAGLVMRLLGRFELTSGWCMLAKHVPGVENEQADGISGRPRREGAQEVSRLVGSGFRVDRNKP